MKAPFDVEWKDEGSARSVRVTGEVDLVSVSELRRAMEGPQSRLEVDLSNVTFIDLAALKCFVDATREHQVVVLIPSPRVERLLDLTETRHLFDIS